MDLNFLRPLYAQPGPWASVADGLGAILRYPEGP
jgi:hypothetical protein